VLNFSGVSSSINLLLVPLRSCSMASRRSILNNNNNYQINSLNNNNSTQHHNSCNNSKSTNKSKSKTNEKNTQKSKKTQKQQQQLYSHSHFQPLQASQQQLQTGKNQRQVYLENSWTFWYDKYIGPKKTVEEYEAALVKIATFDCIQDFWKWHNNLPAVNMIQTSSSFHLMKCGIRPLWEDKANANGGNFSFKLPKEDVNDVWLQLSLRVIGEQFFQFIHKDDEICGITFSQRKNDAVIAIWQRTASLVDVKSLTAVVQSFLPGVSLSDPTYRVHRANDNFSEKQ